MQVAYQDDAVVIRLDTGPGDQSVDSLARAIAAYLLQGREGARAPLAAPSRPAGLVPEKLARVRAYIEEHIAERLPTERLAAAVFMSPFHFSRLFKLAAGEPPHGYVTRRRVERAKILLAHATLPLVHVAAAVGFQTQGHFTEVFRRRTGTTPRRFRLASRISKEV
jgi:transcriptional regulator GlxA family with amidase domain